MKRRLTVFVLLMLVLTCVFAFAAGCKKEGETTKAGPEGGTYYCVDEDSYKITLGDNNKFTFKVKGEDRKGDYTLAATTLTLKFGKDEVVEAKLENYNELTFTYKSEEYRFLREKYFNVRFETSGGSNVQSQDVMNGKKATKPAAAPTLDGSIFTGWYKDQGLSVRFDFDSEIITEDTTVYAKYIKAISNPPEFTIKFAGDGVEAQPVQTLGGIVDINKVAQPSKAGDEFLGWYVSATNDPEKLTYKYEFEKLNENTTLFALWASRLNGAPDVSVKNGKVSWTGDNATVKITAPGGQVSEPQVSGNEYEISADILNKEGEYTVTVTAGDKSTTRYYTHKGLARVSIFDIDGNDIQFNRVENATAYELHITAKDREYTITDGIELDDQNKVGHYSFEAYDIPENGYVFKVVAKANGYATSESDEYVYNRILDKAGDIQLDDATQDISWKASPNATSYTVKINGDEYSAKNARYTIKNLDPGEIVVEVAPKAFGWNSPDSTRTTITKTRLAVCSELRSEGDELKWAPVKGNKGYVVTINGKDYPTDKESFTLKTEYVENGKMEITVTAKGASAAADSPKSEVFNITLGEMGNVEYKEGKLKWDAVFGANEFDIQINNGDPIIATGTEKAIVLTDKNNEIKIRVHKDGSKWKTIYVTAFEIKLNVGYGNDEYYGSMFKQEGDPIDFSDTSSIIFAAGYQDVYQQRFGYNFGGFFTSEYNAGGTAYTENTFIYDHDIEFIAHWEARKHTVTFDLNFAAFGITGQSETIQSMTFTYDDNNYSFPVPTTDVPAYMFYGWYYSPSNSINFGSDADRYTNENGNAYAGKSLSGGTFDGDITVYARWVQTITFTKNAEETEYIVSVNSEYKSLIKQLTVPATYDELPVTQLENFQSCLNLTVINIPDTIKAIHLGQTGEVFKSCSALVNVNVYPVEGTVNPVYSSIDGVLFKNDDSKNAYSLEYYPYGRFKNNNYTEYKVPYGIRSISIGAFYRSDSGHVLRKLILPASIENIDKSAIVGIDSLTEIYFEREDEKPADKPDATANVLNISEGAFSKLDVMEKINIPKRLTSVNVSVLATFKALKNLTVETDNPVYSASENVLYMKRSNGEKELVYYPLGLDVKDGKYVVPDDVHHIGTAAFKSNTKIVSLTISATVKSIGESAFESCTKIAEYKFLGGESSANLSIGKNAFKSASSSSDIAVKFAITLPANLTGLGANAFGGASKIDTVYITTSGADRTGVEFEAGAFIKSNGDAYVTTLHIGEKVPEFDISGVFGKSLETVMFDKPNDNFYVQDGVIFNKEQSKLFFFPKNYQGSFEIPEKMEAISDYMFYGQSGLSTLIIPSGVRLIGEFAFYGCDNLTKVEFKNDANFKGATEEDTGLAIKTKAFQNCSRLQTITLPNTLTSIGEFAFSGCSRLSDLTLPEYLRTVGDSAFNGCVGLKAINIPKSLEQLDTNSKGNFMIFNGCINLKTITVDPGNEKYAAQSGVLYLTREITEGGVNKFVPDTLVYCPSGAEGTIEVPSTVRSVGGYAFYNIANVTKVNFADLEETENTDADNPDTAELKLAPYAFYNDYNFGNESIKEIHLPNGLKILGEPGTYYQGPISYLKALTKINVPNTVTNMYSSFVYECSNLSQIIFDEGGEEGLRLEDSIEQTGSGSGYSTTTDYGMFSRMPKLKTLELPERLTYIGKYTFVFYQSNNGIVTQSCSFDSVTFKNSSKYKLDLGDYALARVTFTINLPNNIASIGKYAFKGCKFDSFEIPAGITKIGDNAFSDTGLRSITIPNTVEEIGYSAFSAYDEEPMLETVIFQEGGHLAELGKGSGGGSSSLNGYVFKGQTKLHTIQFAKDNNNVPLNIYQYNFQGCTGLQNITIPSYAKSLGNFAFQNCKNLTSITFEGPSLLEEVGQKAFNNTKITQLLFAESADTVKELKLGASLFLGVGTLEKVKLPNTVKTLSGALDGCMINNIELEDNNPYFRIDNNSKTVYDNNNNIVLIFGDISRFTIEEGTSVISAGAFAGIVGLTTIVIPQSVTEIQNGAFKNCLDLTTVEIQSGSNLKTIDYSAFENCPSLTKIDLKNCTKLTKIGYRAFAGCTSLTSATLPDGFKGFTSTSTKQNGSQLFQGCSSLVNIDLSNTAFTHIPFALFLNCTSLQTVKFPTTVTNLGNRAFEGDMELTTVENLEYVSTFAGFKILDTGLRSYTLRGKTPSGKAITYPASMFAEIKSDFTILLDEETIGSLTKIGSKMFQNATGIKSIDFSKFTGLQTIDANAFDGSGITEVNLANCSALTTINADAFANCASLQSVSLKNCSMLKTFGKEVFLACPTLTSVDMEGCKSFVDGIAASVFKNCVMLSSVKLPASMTYLGVSTFEGCSALQTIDLSALTGLKFIGNASGKATASAATTTFKNCVTLSSVILPEDGGISLGASVFSGCTMLNEKGIDLSKFIQIGNTCFEKCGFTSIDVSASIKTWGNTPFLGCNITTINVDSSLTTVPNGLYKGFEGFITIDLSQSAITKIPNNMFENCVNLTTVILNPDKITEIGNNAFAGSGITSLDLSGFTKLTKIGTSVFKGCDKLQTLKLPTAITTIPNNTFEGCALLSETNVFDLELTSIGTSAFAGCVSLAIDLSKENLAGVTTLSTSAFSGTNIVVADMSGWSKLKGIGQSVFQDCAKLTTVSLPTSVAFIGVRAFQNCVLLTEIDLSELTDLKALGTASATAVVNSMAADTYTFGGCIALQTVKLPSSCTQLAPYLFYGCTALKDIDLSHIDTLGWNIFENVSLDSIDLSSVKTIVVKSSGDKNGNPFVNLTVQTIEIGSSPALKLETVTGTDDEYKQLTDADGTIIYITTYSKLPEVAPDEEGTLDLSTYNLTETTVKKLVTSFEEVSKVILPNTLESISSKAFQKSTITEIVIPKSLTEIGEYAFDNCASLKTVTFEDGDDAAQSLTLGRNVFSNCPVLEKVVLPKRLTAIPDCAFFKDVLLSDINIGEGIVSIGMEAFNSVAVSALKLPDSLTSIGHGAFRDAKLSELTFSETAQLSLGISAFQNTLITKLEIPSNAFFDGVAQATFYQCALLETVTFKGPTNITTLDVGAKYTFDPNASPATNGQAGSTSSGMFTSCSALRTVVLADGITTLGNYCFQGCESLTSVTLPKDLETMSTQVFKGCSNLTRIEIPESVTSIATTTFSGWQKNQTIVVIGDRFIRVKSIGMDWAYSASDTSSSWLFPTIEFKPSDEA